MMVTRVSPSALSDLRPAWRLAGLAGPAGGVQGHRDPCVAARGCRAAPRPSRPRLDWAGRAVLAALIRVPAPEPADAPAGHTWHRAPVAPPPGHQEMELSEPEGTPTGQRRDRCADRTARHRESQLGIPAYPGR